MVRRRVTRKSFGGNARMVVRRGTYKGKKTIMPLYRFGGLNTIYRFRQVVYNYNNGVQSGHTGADPWITQTNADQFGGILFKLSDLPQVATFTALFDQYRIAKVMVELIPRGNVLSPTFVGTSTAGTAGVVNSVGGNMATVVDMDNATAATTMNQIRECNSCKDYPSYRAHKYVITPHIALAAYGGGVFTAYANQGKTWIDSGSNAVEHYGLKWGLSGNAINGFFCLI